MKLENVKVGTKVRVKQKQELGQTPFYTGWLGSVGTIVCTPDEDGNVVVEFSDGYTDLGHYSNLKRIKEKHS